MKYATRGGASGLCQLSLRVAFALVLGLWPTAGLALDGDGDGLDDGLESSLGCDPAKADTDGDGLIDGADPDIVVAALYALQPDDFGPGAKGLAKAATARLLEAEQAFLAEDIGAGLQMLKDLRMRFDGCPPLADVDDWVVCCDPQLEIRALIDLVISNHFDFTVDPSVAPDRTVPGLKGGPPRETASLVAQDETSELFVADEVVLYTADPAELEAFLLRYGGTVLRDGQPLLLPDALPPSEPPVGTGWYLVRVDPATSPTSDLAARMEDAGLRGLFTYSSESAARLTAIVARENTAMDIGLNYISEPQHDVWEHPLDATGTAYTNAAHWWYMTEDDDPATPGDQGRSVGVVHAWRYLKYHGYPPMHAYHPVRLAIIDVGFDFDEVTGVPLYGRPDFVYSGYAPLQLDEQDGDYTAGGLSHGDMYTSCANCLSKPTECSVGCWHGHATFSACCALPNNNYGGAGSSGGEVRPLFIRHDHTHFGIAMAVHDALYNSVDVINMSVGSRCGESCATYEKGNVLKAMVESAINFNTIVVASSGNEGDDITGKRMWPCQLSSVICVASLHPDGSGAGNYGDGVDLRAPGGAMHTTVIRPRALADANDYGSDETATVNGTSFAAPFAAGIVAMMRMLDPVLPPWQALARLQSTWNPLPASAKPPRGYVDAYRALVATRSNAAPLASWASPLDGGQLPYFEAAFKVAVDDPEWVHPYASQFPVHLEVRSDRGGLLCSATGMGPSLGCTAETLDLGAHRITATVTDAFGATATDAVDITVYNEPPTARIDYPNDGATAYAGQAVNLRGYGFDPEGALDSVTWHSSLNGILGHAAQLWVPALKLGDHTLTFIARDEHGVTASDSITLHVVEGAGYPTAVIVAPTPYTVVAPGTPLTFVGEGTDPEDGTLTGTSLRWTSNMDGLLGTGSSLSGVVLSGPTSESIVHVITLEATDSDGHKATHAIEVVVFWPE